MDFFDHGGDVYSHHVDLDFSSNLNPLGMPAQVREALVGAVDTFDVYPDVECRELTSALAQAKHVDGSTIVCTAGASDLIMRTVFSLRPKTALICAPAFSEYEKALALIDTRVRIHDLREDEGFELTERILDDITSEIDLMFLCTPNNPTGLTIDRALLVRILERAQSEGVYVLLDECFLCFTAVPSAVNLCERYPNLIVMKAFTKLYSMAGLRLGYGICADTALVARLKGAGQTWAVSTPAQVAGKAALSVPQWEETSRAYVTAARMRLIDGLRTMGLRVIEGKANYLLFQCEQPLYDELLERGVLIRSCANYRGLDGTWFRVAVRTIEENEQLLRIMWEVVSG